MGACSEISRRQKNSETTNQSNDILAQNKNDKSKTENAQKKSISMISK